VGVGFDYLIFQCVSKNLYLWNFLLLSFINNLFSSELVGNWWRTGGFCPELGAVIAYSEISLGAPRPAEVWLTGVDILALS